VWDKELRGIYSIRNKAIPNRVYIGASTDINMRLLFHVEDLDDRVHHNYKLQRDWDHYGRDKFEFKILDEVKDPYLLYTKELSWMRKTQSLLVGYNLAITLPNGSNIGISSMTTEEILAVLEAYTDGIYKNNLPYGFWKATGRKITYTRILDIKRQTVLVIMDLIREWSITRTPNTDLSELDTPDIHKFRSDFRQRLNIKDLAEELEVSTQTITNIIYNKTFKFLPYLLN
jgi:group I intron endonuclease